MSDLTDAQIDAMPAGWEMDAAVAMEVMGFRWMKDSTNSARRILLPTRHTYLVLRPWIVPADGSEREAAYPFEHVPRYSIDIAAAYEMESQLPEALQNQYGGALVIAIKAEPNGCAPAWRLVHATPLERCRAALKAARRSKEAGR